MSAKAIDLRPISSSEARRIVEAYHYSGKVKNNAQLHIGVFWHGSLEGALSFGPSQDKRRMANLVKGTCVNGFCELNRMAFSPALPRNSESRALGIAFRLFRRYRPDVEWIVSFADAAQCGDGVIYRASGFLLTGIAETQSMCRLPDGRVVHVLALNTSPHTPRPELGGRSYFDVTGGVRSFRQYIQEAGAEPIGGHQIRYIMPLNGSVRDRLAVPALPYSALSGLCDTIDRDGGGGPPRRGGSSPTVSLHWQPSFW